MQCVHSEQQTHVQVHDTLNYPVLCEYVCPQNVQQLVTKHQEYQEFIANRPVHIITGLS